ncbi:MAG: hypothetical protein JWL63_1289 [Rhodocyclales bacterium]|nr:hypothetical protein [Rhodocyclales bacterium]
MGVIMLMCLLNHELPMSHAKSREIVLDIKMTEELLQGLAKLRETWKRDPASLRKGLSCTESNEGEFVLVAAESAFVTLPGACVITSVGAVELADVGPVFVEGAHSKTLILRSTPDGWRFSVKFVPPVVRERNLPH